MKVQFCSFLSCIAFCNVIAVAHIYVLSGIAYDEINLSLIHGKQGIYVKKCDCP